MPVSTSEISVAVVHQASQFPEFARRTLDANPVNANIILPALNKCLELENSKQPLEGQLWIIVHTLDHVQFIVSCTTGYMGEYPIFFFTPIPYAALDPRAIRPALQLVAEALVTYVPPRRVYSIFAPEVVAVTFAPMWTSLTGIVPEQDPYYHAKVGYLTNETFINKRTPPLSGAQCELRPGHPGDIPAIAELCFLFAQDSQPFTLTQAAAMREATILVNSRSVWVYAVTDHGYPKRIASIVATTRNTQSTAAITKVVTHPDFRGLGCAEALVRMVCRELLTTGKRYIVLYVGVNNRAANVYKRVGFVGVGAESHPAKGVEPWLELGFNRTQVRLGHW